MSKTRIFALTLIALMLVAVFTNPTTEQMEAEVKAKATQLLKQEAGKERRSHRFRHEVIWQYAY